jgi:glycosyltransferase involved in cell wall biosynthesis
VRSPTDDTVRRHIVICNWRDSAHPRSGGAELYCEEVARQLHAEGHRVTFVTARAKGCRRSEPTDYGRVVRLGGDFTTYVLVLVWLVLHRSDIDGVIDSANGIPYFAPLALKRRTPVALLIHHVHQDQFALYLPAPAALVGRLLEKWVSRWVYGPRPVCVVSPSVRAEVRRRLAFKGPIVIAPNGASIVDGHSRTRPARPTILTVGRLMAHKRLHLLVEAVPALLREWPDLDVHIVGDGEERRALADHVRALGLEGTVRLHGRLPAGERDRLMRSAWLTVNPSVGEGWGLSVIEAAAEGTPAVAFRVPGLRDSVRHGITGWLVDHDADLAPGIAEALRAVSDEAVAQQFAERCRAWAASFSWKATALRLHAVLESETDRLGGRLDDRRGHSDVATVVAIPRRLFRPEAVGRLRRHDQVRIRNDEVQLLLDGADEHDVATVLHRLGVRDGAASDIRLARHHDLLGWRPRSTAGLEAPAEIIELHAEARRASGA